MRARIISGLRILFGALFLVFFLMWVFEWKLPDVPPRAMKLREGLLAAGYFFPVIYNVYLLVGLSYLTNRFVPLATIVLFPITLNVVLYHIFLVPNLLPLTAFLVIPQGVMIYASRGAYRPLLEHRSSK